MTKEKKLFQRASGILLHPTSLPGRFGMGDLGIEAFRFIDFLQQSGQHLWQMLPLGPVGLDNSPYQCLSVFAGNELLISPQKLIEDKLLESSDLKGVPHFSGHQVDYELATEYKSSLLRKSFEIFSNNANPSQRNRFKAFCRRNAHWLDDYSLFRALKEAHAMAPWNAWEHDIRLRRPKALAQRRIKLRREILNFNYQQFQFFSQWAELKKYCHKRGIRLIGDIPIFVAFDSAEVWSHQELFRLDGKGNPTVVAGVPPDYFSKTGQFWGNPLYRWDVMASDGYAWWIERLRAMRRMVDIIRVDHFRGFEKHWEIPGTETTAINGCWVPGPGASFFETVRQKLGNLPIIAEDLGIITQEVEELRDQLGFPGMRVLQFAFGDDCDTNIHRPHNYPRHCAAYTGTHDNDTTVGWFKTYDSSVTTLTREAHKEEKLRALNYTRTDGREINWDFIRLVLMSAAETAIIPLQDVLGLGSEARMNVPGRSGGNWRWRFTSRMLTVGARERLRQLTIVAGRYMCDPHLPVFK